MWDGLCVCVFCLRVFTLNVVSLSANSYIYFSLVEGKKGENSNLTKRLKCVLVDVEQDNSHPSSPEDLDCPLRRLPCNIEGSQDISWSEGGFCGLRTCGCPTIDFVSDIPSDKKKTLVN